RYTGLGVECIQGKARITSPWTVQVGGRTLRTRAIVIAAGARPIVPPIPGIERAKPLTSDTVWELRELPRRLIVLGGGPIGCALGRAPNTAGYGLEELGIPVTKSRTVETDEYLQTLYPNIYACGDVAGPYQFTHTASHQAWYAAVNALFAPFRRFRADYSVIPWATFTDPEVARVGLNESEAQERGIAHEVTVVELAELDRAIVDEAAHGLVKVLTA